jgi:hypothetical protein
MYPLPIGKFDPPFNPDSVFSVPPDARRKHVAIFGKSGTGKSVLMGNMLFSDIRHGLGVTVLDPHGGLVERALEMIPRSRTNDVIYFRPYDLDRVLGINILDVTGEKERALAVSHLLSIFKALWADSWGPRMEDVLRNAAFALIEQPQPQSLLAIPRLLNDPNYRRQILKHVSNPAVQAFFHVYDAVWDKRFRAEAISPVLNKVNAFITNPLLRAIIGQPVSSFDFRWMMDNEKILLCDLSKGALGEDVSALLGSLVFSKLTLAALSRQDVLENERPIHFLYADEVQNFAHGAKLPTILSEARKYNLVLTIATQTISQLPREAADAVFGNCATIISFRVGGEDAETLKREFATLLPASELQDLTEYKAYVRTMTSDRPAMPTGPHLVTTFPPVAPEGIENEKQRVIDTSLHRWTRPRAEVNAALDKFLSSPS